MKNKITALVLVLSISVFACLFTGCGNNDVNDNYDNNQATPGEELENDVDNAGDDIKDGVEDIGDAIVGENDNNNNNNNDDAIDENVNEDADKNIENHTDKQ